MKKLVIFDLDGTLLNTIADLGTAVNYSLEQAGLPGHDAKSYPRMVGNGVRKLIERSLPESLRTPENIDARLVDFKKYYDEHMTDQTVPYLGITELLADLTQRGIKVAVASNKYKGAVEKLINYYFPDIPWASIQGQQEGVQTKPDPSIVFEILAECPTPKAQVLYVGDSGVDMETARRACVESCGVTWGFRPLSELLDNHADHTADNTSQLLRLALSDSALK